MDNGKVNQYHSERAYQALCWCKNEGRITTRRVSPPRFLVSFKRAVSRTGGSRSRDEEAEKKRTRTDLVVGSRSGV